MLFWCPSFPSPFVSIFLQDHNLSLPPHHYVWNVNQGNMCTRTRVIICKEYKFTTFSWMDSEGLPTTRRKKLYREWEFLSYERYFGKEKNGVKENQFVFFPYFLLPLLRIINFHGQIKCEKVKESETEEGGEEEEKETGDELDGRQEEERRRSLRRKSDTHPTTVPSFLNTWRWMWLIKAISVSRERWVVSNVKNNVLLHRQKIERRGKLVTRIPFERSESVERCERGRRVEKGNASNSVTKC